MTTTTPAADGTTITAYVSGDTVRITITPGMFLAETLWTDTRVYEVVRVTARTITVRSTMAGEILDRRDDGSGFPTVWTEALSDPDGYVKTVRVRKDGTVRTGQGARPMRPAGDIDGRPVTYTDYRV
jgi:hypothetical protein